MKIKPLQIKKIKTLQGKLGLADDIYRDVLNEGYGVKSAKDLTLHQANELIRELETKAVDAGVWEMRTSGTKANRWKYNNLEEIEGKASRKQLRMLNAMWNTSPKVRNKTDKAFEAFVFRIARVEKLNWLPIEKVRKIKKAIESL